jgi:DNA uptake protein ComE-like DNA-binding protein
LSAQEFEHQEGPIKEPQAGEQPQPEPALDTMDMETQVANLSKKLKALEAKVWDSAQANERIQERFIQTLEVLDSRIASGRQASAAKLESLINSLGATINEVKGVVRTEAKNTEETVWRGLGQLEAKISQSGAETQHRLARAVATLSIAAEEWRAAAPALAANAEESVVESLLALDAAVARGQQSISQHLERSIIQLSESIQAWKTELETSTKRTQERVWSGLNSLEKRINDQMKELEARIQERQMAMVTLIIGGGGTAGQALLPDAKPIDQAPPPAR